MSEKPTLFIIGVILVAVFVAISLLPHRKWEASLVSPFSGIMQTWSKPSPTPILSPTPKTFQFDSSTDLKQELDSINPQVLDEDFN